MNQNFLQHFFWKTVENAVADASGFWNCLVCKGRFPVAILCGIRPGTATDKMDLWKFVPKNLAIEAFEIVSQKVIVEKHSAGILLPIIVSLF